jgi:hypothetical protein
MASNERKQAVRRASSFISFGDGPFFFFFFPCECCQEEAGSDYRMMLFCAVAAETGGPSGVKVRGVSEIALS